MKRSPSANRWLWEMCLPEGLAFKAENANGPAKGRASRLRMLWRVEQAFARSVPSRACSCKKCVLLQPLSLHGPALNGIWNPYFEYGPLLPSALLCPC